MRVSYYFFFFGSLLTLGGCTKQPVSEAEMVKYIMDDSNGLIQRVKKDDIVLELIYRPTDLLVAQEVSDTTIKQDELDSLRSRFSNYSYFVLKLSREGQEATNQLATDLSHYTRAIDYLSFQIGQDIDLVFGNERIDTEDFMHTRSFGGAKANTVMLAFKIRPEELQDFAIEYDDSLFGTGLTRFNFKVSDIESLPPITIQSSI